jgi:hypothetical protein
MEEVGQTYEMSGAEEGMIGDKIEVLKYMSALIPEHCCRSILNVPIVPQVSTRQGISSSAPREESVSGQDTHAKSVIITPLLKLLSLRTSP